jgi:hypothetical protein
MENFLGFDFSPLKIDHQPLLDPIFKRYPQPLACYTFAAQFSTAATRSTCWCLLEEAETLLLSHINSGGQRVLLQPIGLFSKELQQQLLRAIKFNPAKIICVSESFVSSYPDFCRHFSVEDDPKMDNYLYQTVDLATLHGRRYAKKRNLIAQAESQYRWTIEPLTGQCMDSCVKILVELGQKETSSPELAEELQALTTMLNHFAQLKQRGYKILVEGVTAAFSLFESLNPTTAVIHFEKADRHDKGLYQLINREVAKRIQQEGFSLINREEDLGDPGIHQAKMSYFPTELVKSFEMIYRG